MKPTKAVYVDWHMPRKRRGQIHICKKPWEIAMIIRTSYFSRHYNGLVPVLYCDPETLLYYQKLGMDKCFREIYPILPVNPDFDPSIFWAAGKFMAIDHIQENFMLIDLDAEIRYKIRFPDSDVFCSHVEGVTEDDSIYYPDPIYLDPSNYMENKYGFKWENKAYNTSILWFKDISVAKEYASAAMDFIRSIDTLSPGFDVAYILLAEQRFLYEFCKYKGLDVNTLISGIYWTKDIKRKIDPHFEKSDVDYIGKKGFLHVWGFKNEINIEEKEIDLYKSLLLSRPNLVKQIEESVSINNEIYESIKLLTL